MIERGEGTLPPVKVGDNFLMSIHTFDRGRSGPPHLITLIVEGKFRVISCVRRRAARPNVHRGMEDSATVNEWSPYFGRKSTMGVQLMAMSSSMRFEVLGEQLQRSKKSVAPRKEKVLTPRLSTLNKAEVRLRH